MCQICVISVRFVELRLVAYLEKQKSQIVTVFCFNKFIVPILENCFISLENKPIFHSFQGTLATAGSYAFSLYICTDISTNTVYNFIVGHLHKLLVEF